jgi:hypothetical protein
MAEIRAGVEQPGARREVLGDERQLAAAVGQVRLVVEVVPFVAVGFEDALFGLVDRLAVGIVGQTFGNDEKPATDAAQVTT